MAPTAVRGSVGNLPSELTSFVGRRKEVQEAKALLAGARLLTLTGMGGVGKTRLARRLAADVHRAFPDGVWLVELAELHEPALVAATIGNALGLREPPDSWTLGSLQERLVDRHLLLVLDNCEHLIDACAVTTDALLRSCPDLQVLATSRQSLGIDGEQTLALAPLPFPDPEVTDDLNHLERFDAARLFVERAGAALPGFAVVADNQRAVAELCQRLDGLPLALEFAATRVRALAPSEILARLDQLSGGASRTAPSRQQTLHALVDWSYQLCSAEERDLWCRLSVCAGRFDLVTADGISGRDASELVLGLVDKSVLVREQRDGRVHYRMAQTIKAYGRARLVAAGLEEEAQRCHSEWFLDLATQAHAAYASADQLTWFRRLREQHPDIRAALEFAMGTPEMAERIVLSLLDYWLAFGFLTEGRHWLDRVLRSTDSPSSRAGTLRGLAYLAGFQGDVAASSVEQARRQTHDPHELAWCDYTDSATALFQGDFERASYLSAKAATSMREVGDVHGLLDVLASHAVIQAMGGDLASAQAAANEFLAIADPLGERWLRAYVLWALALAHWKAGDLDRAKSLAVESMSVRLEFEDRLGLVWSAEVLGWIAAGEGRHVAAAQLLGASARAAEQIGSTISSFAFLEDGHAQVTAELERHLDPPRLAAARSKGVDLSPAQVLALAQGHSDAGSEEAAPTSLLTRREREIAELVAEGLSNKEIAARLVIATRTAEGHVEHILVKLGFTSRTQIATWVTASG